MASDFSPSFQPWTYGSEMSSVVAVVGMLTVFEIPPDMNGCTAAIMRMCPV